ncbi:MAG: prohibitin family protein [Bacteroidetes bacterium]|jgi:regulator of protease activity HflC (stomatin/prohibitin superfamily)|nr:MAG: prohibitin family protein [Bacteroidota bacterium]
MNKSRVLTIALTVIGGLFLLMLLTSGLFTTIESGHKGIMFRKFGGGLDKETIYEQGFHVVAPWNTMIPYEVRLQSRDENLDVLTVNGLSVKIDLSFRYQPVTEKIGYLHDEIGQDYLDRIIIPEIRSTTRQVIGRYTPEELYSNKRDQIEQEIFTKTETILTAKFIELDAVLIRDITLPDQIKTAIENKLKEEQEVQRLAYSIDKEKRESERKRIEAEGQAAYQRIITQTLSPQYLQYQGILITEKLATSSNAKTVIIGSGKDGLPLIMGGN